jgi:hypothetical protein
MRPRLVALLVAAALTTGWLLASLLTPPVAELQTLPPRVERSRDVVETRSDAPFAEQLRLRLRSAPPPPTSRRNPFLFAEPSSTRRELGTGGDNARRTSIDGVKPAAAGPSLRLSGIGSSVSENDIVRTAVIADGTTVHLVKIGETIAGYTVAEISDDAVVVQNDAGERWILRMR